ncbi:MAG: HlyD family efflux transporter periplasmic adaptor subunit [Acaryochloris sp. RU_4_1]|nr:HlyD family efflux transporter periplasmic adaptor subunit [Acaryochloris sp. RU_4_1]NJR53274.1 HlyD family efflux transporter periplasmic adaptor subunit [Acaryochloris sp. CRU_2_0]
MIVNSAPNSLRNVHRDEFLPPIHLWTRLGGLVLVGAVGAAISLASVIPYNVVVRAPATVRPLGENRVVQVATEGVVSQIVVQENQVVQKGDAIAHLDDSLLHTQKRQLQGNIQQNQRQLTQIVAQILALDERQAAEATASGRAITVIQAELNRTQRDYREKQIATQTELQEAQANLELAQEELKRYQQLANTGATPQLQVKEKKQAFKAALARWKRAQAKVNPSNASVTIAIEQIAQQTAQGRATLAKLKQERESLVSRQAEIENQLNRDRQALQQLERDHQKSVVRATTAGTILKLGLRNPSQVLHRGESIAQISPSQSSLIIKARVAAQDISGVQICKHKRVLDCQVGKVQLRISAYPYPDYGTLNGAVVAISADATTTQSSPTSPSVSYYEVMIQPENPFLVKGDRRYALQAGMDVTANIIAKQETVLTFVLRKARLLTDL